MPGQLEIDVVAKRLETVTKELQKHFEMVGKKIETDLSESISNGGKKWSAGVMWSLKEIGSFISSTVIVGGFTRLSQGILTLAGNLEQAKISFEVMLGSAQAADTLLKDLADFAAKTPFEVTGIRQNAKQLLAMWVEAGQLIPTLKALGDVSAGLSVPLERLALNYGQVISSGKLTGRELRDFTLAGVPILEELSGMLGKTTAQIGDMISNGEITSDIVVAAFQNMSSEGGKFADLMDRQSTTLQGSRSNLRDSVSYLGEAIGTIFIPALTSLVNIIRPVIDGMKERVEANPEAAKRIGIVVTALVALIGVMGTILPIIGLASTGLTAMGLSFAALAGPIWRTIAGIAALAIWVTALSKQFTIQDPIVKKAEASAKKLERQMDRLRMQREQGKISSEEYAAAMDPLKKQQEAANTIIQGGATSVEDYRQRMIDLANTQYEWHEAEFAAEKAKIMEMIAAIRVYKQELLNAQITELEGAKQKQKIEGQQALVGGGWLATLTDSEVNNLTFSVMNLTNEIADADKTAANFDTEIADLRKKAEEAKKPVTDLGAWIGDLAGGGGGWKKKGAEEAKEALEKLEDTLDDIGDRAKDLEQKNEDYNDSVQDMTDKTTEYYKTVRDEIRSITEDILEANKKYQDSIVEINKKKEESLSGNTSSFVRWQAEKEADIQEQIVDLEKEKQKIQDEYNKDLQKVNEQQIINASDIRKQEEDRRKLEEKRLEKQAELDAKILEANEKLLRVKENISAIADPTIVNAERARAALSDEERALQDFQAKQKEVEETARLEEEKTRKQYEEDTKRLENKKKIVERLNEYEFKGSEDIYNLLKSKEFERQAEKMTNEELALFEKIALEKAEVLKANEDKKKLEKDLIDYTLQLNNDYTEITKKNLDGVKDKYKELIAEIDRAISRQQFLNSIRNSGGGGEVTKNFNGGPVSPGGAHLVGENADGTANATTEMFIPGQAGNIISARRLQEAMQETGYKPTNVDNSRNVSNHGDIYFNQSFDFELRLERQKFLA